MMMLARASLAALFGLLLLGGFSGAAQAQFQGSLWLVSNKNLNATRPVPAPAPDATFVTRHVSFAMSGPPGYTSVNNTVESFLASAHPDAAPPVRELTFSGLYNSVVGAVVDGATPVENATSYGTYMRLEGTIQLTNGQLIVIGHDNGVNLWIDGVKIPGFNDSGIQVALDTYTFTGLTGAHTIVLIYVNQSGPGFLSFSPKM
jgi:hypothetical protein